MQADNVLNNLNICLTSEFVKCVLLKGKWGTGKTYLWNKFIEQQPTSRHYAYISLFGVKDTESLKAKLFEESHRYADSDESKGKIRKFVSKGRAQLRFLSVVPKISDYEKLIRALEWSRIKKYIICIDDIERRSEGLKIKEILGFVTHLAEERECKVFIIGNIDQLEDPDRDDLNKYKEKTVDVELELDPSIESAVEIVFSKENKHYKPIFDVCNAFGINNIRIVKKIKFYIERIFSWPEHLTDYIIDKVSTHVAVIVIAYFCKIEGLSVSMVVDFHPFGFALKSGTSKSEKSIASSLYEIGYSGDPIDVEIEKMISNGDLNAVSMKKLIEKLKTEERAKELAQKLKTGWNLLLNTFAASEQEIANTFTDILDHHLFDLPYSEVRNIQSALNDIRTDNDDYLSRWVGSKLSVLTLNEVETIMKEPLINEEMQKKLKEQSKTMAKTYNLTEVLSHVRKAHGWNPDMILFLKEITEQEIFEWATKSNDPEVFSDLHEGLSFGIISGSGEADYQAIGRKFYRVCRAISKTSSLNKLRISRFLGEFLSLSESPECDDAEVFFDKSASLSADVTEEEAAEGVSILLRED